MAVKSDIEIAREADLRPITEIGAKLDIPADQLLQYGPHKAKVSYDFIKSVQANPDGKLILVTAITPTAAGEGKTTTTVGLGDGLNRIGKHATICIREPSLGPCFGMKGGAAGGGFAQVADVPDSGVPHRGESLPEAHANTQECSSRQFNFRNRVSSRGVNLPSTWHHPGVLRPGKPHT